LLFRERYDDDPNVRSLKFFGQEILASTYAMANMNVFIHNMEAEIALGDTMNLPKFLDERGGLKKFDIVVSNPMWNQNFPKSTYENDTFGRFTFGFPPSSSADWGWVQHMHASLKDHGRMAVVLDTGSVSRGSGTSGSNRERDIRKQFVERDLVEAVILLPENLFYNTSAPGIILVINKNKAQERSSQVLLVNASKLFEKGRPKNYLPDSTIELVSSIYHDWKEEEGISKIVSLEDIAKNDYNLSPSRYVAQNGNDEVLPLDEAVLELRKLKRNVRKPTASFRPSLRNYWDHDGK